MTRSGSKSRATPAKRPQKYADEVKDTALDVIRDDGIAAAHDATGVPKPTLSRWAKAAGIVPAGVDDSRTAAAAAGRRRQLEEARGSTIARLEGIAERAGNYLLDVTTVNAELAEAIAVAPLDSLKALPTLDGYIVESDDPDVRAAARRAALLATAPLQVRDAVGVLTRAIHDLQLLKGEATTRGELVVNFAVPRPSPARTEADVIVLPAHRQETA